MSIGELSLTLLFSVLGILILLSAYFSGSETAMMALNRYRLRHLVKQRHMGARKANRLLRRPDRLLGVILIGNNLVNFTAASVATVIGMRMFGDTGVLIAPWVLTLVFLIFAEVTPKTLAAHAPERLAFTSAFVLEVLLKLLYPVVWFVNGISNVLVKPFIKQSGQQDHLSVEEFRTVVNEGAALPGQHQNMMLSILDLDDVTVNDIMVHRNEISGIDLEDDIPEILEQIASSQHTRLPVYRGNINNIVGILHLRRTTRYLRLNDDISKEDLIQITRDPYFVPERTPLHTQLVNFQKNKRRIALVVDEYGDVQGIVTLEDILEEIVGEFTTDFAARVPEVHAQEDGSHIIDGSALLRDVNRVLNWTLPEDQGPRTINGLLLEYLETIPESPVCLAIGSYRFEVLQISNNAIRSVRATEAPSSTVRQDDAALADDEAELS